MLSCEWYDDGATRNNIINLYLNLVPKLNINNIFSFHDKINEQMNGPIAILFTFGLWGDFAAGEISRIGNKIDVSWGL